MFSGKPTAKVDLYKKKNIARIIVDVFNPMVASILIENGCPRIDFQPFTATIPFYKFRNVIKLLEEYLSIRYDLNFIDEIREYYKFIEVKRDSLESYIDRINDKLAAQGAKLYEHQVDGIRWAALRNGLILADDMGLGKTVIALAATPTKAPILVVAPANAKYVWQNQLQKWFNRDSEVLQGRQSFRFPKDREVVITNYDILPESLYTAPPKNLKKVEKEKFNRELKKSRDSILKNCPPGLVVIADEAHKLKNNKSLRTKRFKFISDKARELGGKTWALTGTPLNNHPEELWAILNCVGAIEESFGTRDNFNKEFGAKFGGWMEWGEPKESVKYYLANVMLRRRADDTLDLPVWNEDFHKVEVDSETLEICNRFLNVCKELDIELEEAVELAKDPGSNLYTHVMKLKSALAISKIPAVADLVEEYESANEIVIVACTHVKPLRYFGARPGWALIDGSVSSQKRNEIEKDFQDGKYKGLALSILAGGEALTLTRCSHMILMDQHWVPGPNHQVKKRIHRISQKRPVWYKKIIINHPLEERIYEIIERKEKLIECTVEKAANLGITEKI